MMTVNRASAQGVIAIGMSVIGFLSSASHDPILVLLR